MGQTELIIVTGKGGVGKTAMAVCCARLLAGNGRRVLLLESDARESAHRYLAISPSGGEAVAAGSSLWLQNLTPRQAVDRLVERRIPIPGVAGRLLAHPIYGHFAEGCPGLKELALLAHAAERTTKSGRRRRERFDVVVLDAPATGHSLALLDAPRLVAEVITSGPAARVAKDVTELLGSRSRSAFVVVAQAEEMPVTESLELARALESRYGAWPDLLLVNALYPPLPEAANRGAAGTGPGDVARQLWRDRRRLNENELTRLAESWPGPRVDLPLLPHEPGPDLIRELNEVLLPALKRLSLFGFGDAREAAAELGGRVP